VVKKKEKKKKKGTSESLSSICSINIERSQSVESGATENGG